MSIPYENATAGDRAINEMQKTLAAFGCQAFGSMVDNERQMMSVSFKWRDRHVNLEASWKGYAQAWLKAHPWSWRKGGNTRAQHDQKALEQARVSVCSVLRDWVKGQTTAVECGVLEFEAVFMPHMLLKDGRRVIDAAREAGATLMGLYDTLAKCHPSIERGMCWCIHCGRKQVVDPAHCFQYGWPLCCGSTMTIDSPQKRAALKRSELGADVGRAKD